MLHIFINQINSFSFDACRILASFMKQFCLTFADLPMAMRKSGAVKK